MREIKYRRFKITPVIVICLLSMVLLCGMRISAVASEQDHFRKYNYPADGFEISFPSKPIEFRTPYKIGSGYSKSYQGVLANPLSQYSVFLQHSSDKVFSDDSIDAYFDGHIRSLMSDSNNTVVTYKKRTNLLGFPAAEYQFADTMEGNSVIVRGMILMVDGNHIRLSQFSLPSDLSSEKNFIKFVNSFRLIPIDGPLSSDRFEDKSRGIAFSPPDGWKQGTTEFTQIPVIYTSPAAHTVQIMDSGIATYKCENYKQEVHNYYGIQPSGVLKINGRPVKWIKYLVSTPSVSTRMTSIAYCLDTTRGAVILLCMAPENTFIRSEMIFQKVATSLIVRK
jgi:hypothetical protein